MGAGNGGMFYVPWILKLPPIYAFVLEGYACVLHLWLLIWPVT